MKLKFCFECEGKGSKAKMHHWKMREDETAYCKNCKMEANKEEAADIYKQR